jgi:hypothetical protein
MRVALCGAFAGLLATLLTPAQAAGMLDCLFGRSDCRDLIGKRMWVVVPKWNPNTVEISQTPNNWDNTRKLRSGSFLITEVLPEKTTGYLFAVSLSDGSTGFVSHDSLIFLSTQDPAAVKAECERRGQPRIGMTTVEAMATCWGKPQQVVKMTTAAGVHERFLYGNGHILEFEGDALSAIIESASAR